MTYPRAVGLLAGAIAAVMAVYHMWVIAFAPPEAFIFRGTHLLFATTLVFLIFPLRTARGPANPGVEDWLAAGLALWAVGRLFADYQWLVFRMPYVDDPRPMDVVGGAVLVVLILEATRRVIGWALPITAMAFLAWAFLSRSATPLGIVDQLYLTTDGIFGSTLGVSAGYVVIFVLFGAFMERSGVGRLFMDTALALTGRATGGPGKVAVVSSSLFGSVSGSAVANVMVTGQVTIPLMLRSGFKAPFAAGVEAVASTGGQIMPPIMGAAAFVMAEFLQVSYLQVVVWATIPALLYYVATFAAVHFEAKRRGLHGLDASEVPRFRTVAARGWHLAVPLVIIIGGLFGGFSAPLAALVATLACFPAAALRPETRRNVTLPQPMGRAGGRRAQHAGHRDGLRLRRHRDRRHRADRRRHLVHPGGGQPGAAEPRAGAADDDGGRDRAGDGHAHHPRLHRDGLLAGAGADHPGRDRAGSASVRLLFRDLVGHHAAGGAGGLRGLGPGEIRPVVVRHGRRSGLGRPGSSCRSCSSINRRCC